MARKDTQSGKRYFKLSRRLKQAKRRALAAGAQGDITVADIQYLIMKQNHRCDYCRTPISLEEVYEIDHIVTFRRSGQHVVANVCLTCRRCNRSKGSMPIEKWYMKLAARGILHPKAPIDTPRQMTLDEAPRPSVVIRRAA